MNIEKCCLKHPWPSMAYDRGNLVKLRSSIPGIVFGETVGKPDAASYAVEFLYDMKYLIISMCY
jgi:hypothetical protein